MTILKYTVTGPTPNLIGIKDTIGCTITFCTFWPVPLYAILYVFKTNTRVLSSLAYLLGSRCSNAPENGVQEVDPKNQNGDETFEIRPIKKLM